VAGQKRHCGRNAIAPRPQAKFLGAETALYLIEIALERRAWTHMSQLDGVRGRTCSQLEGLVVARLIGY
jgi:hypothetical protein